MPKSSDNANTGPSSGSVLSFMAELTKCLSPILSARTTEEVNGLKRVKNLTAIKKVVARLLNGNKIVPDCGAAHSHIPVRILGWRSNKRGTPKIDPEIRFCVTGIVPSKMSVQTALSAPLKQLEINQVFNIVILAYIPGGPTITNFTIGQCTIEVPEEEIFVSLDSIPILTDVNEHDKYRNEVRCSFINNNFRLAVSSGFEDKYVFSIIRADTEEWVSGSIEVSSEFFEPPTD